MLRFFRSRSDMRDHIVTHKDGNPSISQRPSKLGLCRASSVCAEQARFVPSKLGLYRASSVCTSPAAALRVLRSAPCTPKGHKPPSTAAGQARFVPARRLPFGTCARRRVPRRGTNRRLRRPTSRVYGGPDAALRVLRSAPCTPKGHKPPSTAAGQARFVPARRLPFGTCARRRVPRRGTNRRLRRPTSRVYGGPDAALRVLRSAPCTPKGHKPPSTAAGQARFMPSKLGLWWPGRCPSGPAIGVLNLRHLRNLRIVHSSLHTLPTFAPFPRSPFPPSLCNRPPCEI